MNSEMQEVMEQLSETIDPMLLVARLTYKKMATNTEMWIDLASCHKAAMDAFTAAGFSREEAIQMTIAAMGSFGKR